MVANMKTFNTQHSKYGLNFDLDVEEFSHTTVTLSTSNKHSGEIENNKQNTT